MKTRLRTLFGPSHGRTARTLLVASLVDWCGTGLWLTVSALYFSRVVGLSGEQIGLGLTAGGICGFLAIVPVTSITRRLPARDVAVALYLARGLAFAGYLLVDSAAGFFLVVTLVAIVGRPASAVNQLLVAESIEPAERTKTMAAMHVATNVGGSAGALIGTLALLSDARWAYSLVILADAATFWAAGWLVSRIPVNRAATAAAAPRRPGQGARTALGDRRFTVATLANGFLCLHIPLLNVIVPLWLAKRTQVPVALMGGLLLLNTLVVVALQVRIGDRVREVRDGARAGAASGLSLAGACACIAAAAYVGAVPAVGLLVVGVALLTLGEIAQAASGWAVSFGLAPEDGRRPGYLGLFALGQAAAGVFGPAALTFAVFRWSGGWLAVATVLLAASVLAARADRADRASAPVPVHNDLVPEAA